MDDQEITTLLAGLSRPHLSGGVVIERAAILAAGADSPAIIDWILDHAGAPETAAPSRRGRGLHGSRVQNGDSLGTQQPMRFVLPAHALR